MLDGFITIIILLNTGILAMDRFSPDAEEG